MKPSDGPPRDARAIRSRRALIDAARELVLDDETDAVTVSALCQRAEISRPTFYQHFSSPDELLAAMVRKRFDELLSTITESEREDTQALIRRILIDVGQDPRLYRGMLGERPAFSQVRSALEEWLTERLATAFPSARTTDLAFAAGGTARLIAVALTSSGGEEAALDQAAADVWRLIRDTLDVPKARVGPARRRT